MHFKYIFAFLLINCLFITNSEVANSYSETNIICQEDDLAGLKLIYDNMNGENWKHNTFWLTNTSCCNWYGIKCDNNRVSEITLVSNNVSGGFPDLNNTLQFLNKIDMYDNSITGNLNQLLNFKSLAVIDLGTNLIVDELPDQLFQSDVLIYINLMENMLYGTISEINCPQLKNIFLSDNNLSGNFPTIVSSNLYDIFIANNNLVGIPDTFNTTPKLDRLILNNNNILGTLPKSLVNTRIRSLDLSNNNFFGEIPEEFKGINTLMEFYANNNSLSSGINNLINVKAIEIDNNKFNETIGNLLGGGIHVFQARNNSFHGNVFLPCSLGANIIDLTNNGALKGYILYYHQNWCDITVLEYPKYESDGYMCSNIMINYCLILTDGFFFDYKYCD